MSGYEVVKKGMGIKCNSYSEFIRLMANLSSIICLSTGDLISSDFIVLSKDFKYPCWVVRSKHLDGVCWTCDISKYNVKSVDFSELNL